VQPIVSRRPQEDTVSIDELSHRIGNRSFKAGVVGLGYVGLPLAVTIVEAGFEVVGYDISAEVVDKVNAGISTTVDISAERLTAAVVRGLRATTKAEDLTEVDVVFICVPSPLGLHREPDLSFIRSAAGTVGDIARPGMLICLESTTYPGTTREIVLPAVTANGLELDRDILVAYSSERVSPGAGIELRDIPKVVGGVSSMSTRVASEVYSTFLESVHPVATAEVAEFSKLLENTYRAVNIALINELAQFAHRIDVDIWEAIDAAATKPFGFQPFYPGPGVGGHCIPLDPQYLAWRARQEGVSLSFIDSAERVNRSMPEYVASRVSDLLNDRGKSVRGARILAVGIAYKRDVADARESAPLEVLRRLQSTGAHVSVVDPLFSLAYIRSLGLEPAESPLGRYDLGLILTDHSAVDFESVAAASDAIFDTRNRYGEGAATRL
jgi:UDP-N-acetyl-D-glucosamine dehydrogenase